MQAYVNSLIIKASEAYSKLENSGVINADYGCLELGIFYYRMLITALMRRKAQQAD